MSISKKKILSFFCEYVKIIRKIKEKDSIMNKKVFIKGVKSGFPVCLVYLAVSFTFGIQAVKNGLNSFWATLISATNLTSAGQFAGIKMIKMGESFFAVFIAVLIINARYLLMGFSLSQMLPAKTNVFKRTVLSFFITDELYALACDNKQDFCVTYFLGMGIIAYLGWTAGTLLGSLTDSFLPARLQLALGIALYCMFIAIIIPPAKKDKKIFTAIFIASGLSCLLYVIPFFKNQLGLSVILASCVASCICAFVFPVNTEREMKNV